MADEQPAPVTGPRRYRVSFNCRTDSVGAVIGLLIREVESPKMETVGEHYKLTLICMHDQLRTVIDMVLDDADNLIIAPHVPEVKMAPATFRAPKPVYVQTDLQRQVTYAPVKRTRVKGGAKIKDTAAGKAMLAAFANGGRVKHPPDFTEALIAAGFAGNSYSALVHKLIKEGDLVRVGQGAYRLPTTQDQLAIMESRDPSFSSKDE